MRVLWVAFCFTLFIFLSGCGAGAKTNVQNNVSENQKNIQIAQNDGQPQANNSVNWVVFTDPVEQAFSLDVPDGWNVDGGVKRISEIDIRSGTTIQSPDQMTTIFYGDRNIPIFTVPNAILARGGYHAGMWYYAGPGVNLFIEPYMSGRAFAAKWGYYRISHLCSNAQITSSEDLNNASQAMNNIYAQYGIYTSVYSGEATFSCDLNGTPEYGYVYSATELVRNQTGELWDVKNFIGFVAPAQLTRETFDIIVHMAQSYRLNPQWVAAQNNMNAQYENIVTQSNNQISDMIFKGGQQRLQEYYNIGQKYDRVVVKNESNYYDPTTNTTYKGDNRYEYHYITNDNQIINTNHPLQINQNLHELQPQN